MAKIDLTGQRFGRLVALQPVGTRNSFTVWHCRCDCGNEKEAVSVLLRDGRTRSCGCLAQESKSARSTTHGRSKTTTYLRWRSMLNRCTNPRQISYAKYGGSGISVCVRWRISFENFLADMGECPPGHTLDRWPNRVGNYEPGNCRWATPKEQANNTKNSAFIEYRGKRQTLKQWAEELGLKYATVYRRLQHGYPLEDIFATRSFKRGRIPHV